MYFVKERVFRILKNVLQRNCWIQKRPKTFFLCYLHLFGSYECKVTVLKWAHSPLHMHKDGGHVTVAWWVLGLNSVLAIWACNPAAEYYNVTRIWLPHTITLQISWEDLRELVNKTSYCSKSPQRPFFLRLSVKSLTAVFNRSKLELNGTFTLYTHLFIWLCFL